MPVRIGLSIIVAALWSGAAFGACIPTKQRSCVDLSAIPAIAQEVVGAEKMAPLPEKTAPTLPTNTYDGPTLGVSHAARRAPEVKYHWSID
ncbi:MAG TPA: hypothetical protein VHW66_00880 [Stellaceae bacterium]|jgi:hypothetical protein|nr:hypothetical protein [Stellaceae bacterium]